MFAHARPHRFCVFFLNCADAVLIALMRLERAVDHIRSCDRIGHPKEELFRIGVAALSARSTPDLVAVRPSSWVRAMSCQLFRATQFLFVIVGLFLSMLLDLSVPCSISMAMPSVHAPFLLNMGATSATFSAPSKNSGSVGRTPHLCQGRYRFPEQIGSILDNQA